jgi:hypothetical protein
MGLIGNAMSSASRAARLAEHTAAALLGVHVARSLHGRWRRMSAIDRERLAPLAEDVKQRALDIRGESDPDVAGRELGAASERLAGAMVEAAEADPEVSEIEVRELRSELQRELERLAGADIEASRGPNRGSDGNDGRTSIDGVA